MADGPAIQAKTGTAIIAYINECQTFLKKTEKVRKSNIIPNDIIADKFKLMSTSKKEIEEPIVNENIETIKDFPNFSSMSPANKVSKPIMTLKIMADKRGEDRN